MLDRDTVGGQVRHRQLRAFDRVTNATRQGEINDRLQDVDSSLGEGTDETEQRRDVMNL
jgi:hypothetical protein